MAHSAGEAADGNGAAARTKGGAWAHGTRQWAPTARANGRTEGAQQQHGGIPGVALGSAHTTKEPVMVPDWLPAPASSSSSRAPTGVMTPSEWLPSGYCKKEGTSLCGHTARSFDGARLACCGTCTCHRICPGHVLCSGPRAHPPLRAHLSTAAPAVRHGSRQAAAERGCVLPVPARDMARAGGDAHLFTELVLPSRVRRWRCGMPLL